MVLAMLVLLVLTSAVSAAGIPGNYLIVGEKAFSIEYLVDPNNTGDIGAALDALENPSQMYYHIEGVTQGPTGLLNNQALTSAEIAELPRITYTNNSGTIIYEAGLGDEVSEPEYSATASVNFNTTFSTIKVISVLSSDIEEATSFGVEGSALSKEFGESITVTTGEKSRTIELYDSTGSLLASGELDVSKVTDLLEFTVELSDTNNPEEFKVVEIN